MSCILIFYQQLARTLFFKTRVGRKSPSHNSNHSSQRVRRLDLSHIRHAVYFNCHRGDFGGSFGMNVIFIYYFLFSFYLLQCFHPLLCYPPSPYRFTTSSPNPFRHFILKKTLPLLINQPVRHFHHHLPISSSKQQQQQQNNTEAPALFIIDTTRRL